MSLLERLGELGKALLTTDAELRHLRETLSEIRQEVHKLIDGMQEIRERLTRLEASREADRSQMAAELARFKAEVERAELQLALRLSASNEPPALPEPKRKEPMSELEFYWVNVDKPTARCVLHRAGCMYEMEKTETLLKGVGQLKRDGGWLRFASH